MLIFFIFLPVLICAQNQSTISINPADSSNFFINPKILRQISGRKMPSTFIVVAPYNIRSGKPFNVAVRGINIISTFNVVLGISGKSDSGSNVNIKKITEISKLQQKTFIQFVTTNIKKGSYKFTFNSDDYSDEKPLTYITNEVSFLIMTDKPIYFFDDTLRFKIFAIDSETKAVVPKQKTDVLIKDESGRTITTFFDANFVKGIFEGEWKLSSGSSKGIRKIVVQSRDDKAEKIIEIIESVNSRSFSTSESTFPLLKSVNRTVARAFGDPSRILMRLDVLTKDPSIYSQVKMEVTFSEFIDKVTCFLSAKGVLLESLEIPITKVNGQPFQSASFSFFPIFAHAPLTNILCYYVRSDGRIITASSSVELIGQLSNSLTISPVNSHIKFGENIELDIESSMHTTVSLVAVDQRLTSLQNGSCVTKSDIFKDLLKYYRNAPLDSNKGHSDYTYSFSNHGLYIFTNILPLPSSFYYDNIPQAPYQFDGSAITTNLNSQTIAMSNKLAKSILWQNVDIKTTISNKHGRNRVTDVAPKELSNFVICGIAMSSTDGIGLPTNFPSVNVYIPVLIVAEFPESIKRTETLVQSIIIYNFLNQKEDFNVMINKDLKYQLSSDMIGEWKDNGNNFVRTVSIESNRNVKIKFSLKALSTGTISFKITARSISSSASDSIERALKIEPLYETIRDPIRKFIYLDKNGSVSDELKCPSIDNVLNVKKIVVFINGDIVIGRIDDFQLGYMISPPYGNGENVMMNLVPDILVWYYLRESNRYTFDLISKLKQYFQIGYWNMLRYFRNDGAFSLWGDISGILPSTWLTAYTGYWLYAIKDIIYVDMSVLQRGLDFLVSMQQLDGTFSDIGQSYYGDYRGGSRNGTGLNALIANYIFTVLSDFPQYEPNYRKVIKYLELNWGTKMDSSSLAITAYALKLSNSPEFDKIYNILYQRRTESITEIIIEDIESTAYFLLVLIAKGDRYDDALKTFNYLYNANKLYLYMYNHGSVVAMHAITKFLAKYPLYGLVDLELVPNVGPTIKGSYRSQNLTDGLIFELDKNARSVKVIAASNYYNYTIIGLNCQYEIENLQAQTDFNITIDFTHTCTREFAIEIRVSYTPQGQSGLTNVTVSLPPGFSYSGYKNSLNVQKVEVLKNGNAAAFFFDSIKNQDSILNVLVNGSSIKNVVMLGRVEVTEVKNQARKTLASFVLPELIEGC